MLLFVGSRLKYKNFQLHLIGPLQSNKAQLALENFDVIQTIDRVKIIYNIVKTMCRYKSSINLTFNYSN